MSAASMNGYSASFGGAPNHFVPGRSVPFAPGIFRGFLSYERNPMRTRFLSARP